ncbi:MAG TPA: hypothetical protein VGK19_01885 [Capsulimonadaceae bacterium]|jgi:hypothetical protein
MAVSPPGRTNEVSFKWISEAWQLFLKQPTPWIIASATVVVFVLVIDGALYATHQQIDHGGLAAAVTGSLVAPGLSAILWLVINVASAGYIRMAALHVAGKTVIPQDALPAGPSVVQTVLYAVLLGIASSIAACFCLVPGLIVSALFAPGIVLVSQGMTISAAANQSLAATKPYLLQVTLVTLVLGLLVGISGVVAGLGLLLTIPLVYLTLAVEARDLFAPPIGEIVAAVDTGSPDSGSEI